MIHLKAIRKRSAAVPQEKTLIYQSVPQKPQLPQMILTKYFRDTMLRKVRIMRKIHLEQACMLRILCGKTADITY